MTASRDRKEAAKILGITMQAQLLALHQAVGMEAIQTAAIQLGDTFNRNSEFICWVLKEYGGMEQMPFPRAPAPRGISGVEVPTGPFKLVN
jgi:hypothetical protein